jgi:hypothetical protein
VISKSDATAKVIKKKSDTSEKFNSPGDDKEHFYGFIT